MGVLKGLLLATGCVAILGAGAWFGWDGPNAGRPAAAPSSSPSATTRQLPADPAPATGTTNPVSRPPGSVSPPPAPSLQTLAPRPTGLSLLTPSQPGLPPPATEPAQPAASSWSSDDCAWAPAILYQDAALDRQEADLIRRTGGDPRYPSATAAYYDDVAGRWDGFGAEAEWNCRYGAWPDGTYAPRAFAGSCATQDSRLQTARQSHVDDLSYAPQNAAWDQHWIAVYDRLLVLWPEACR